MTSTNTTFTKIVSALADQTRAQELISDLRDHLKLKPVPGKHFDAAYVNSMAGAAKAELAEYLVRHLDELNLSDRMAETYALKLATTLPFEEALAAARSSETGAQCVRNVRRARTPISRRRAIDNLHCFFHHDLGIETIVALGYVERVRAGE